jgi:hypothetical protein
VLYYFVKNHLYRDALPHLVVQRLPLPLIINLPCSRKAKALDISPFFYGLGTIFC